MASNRDADLAGSESDDEPFNYEPAVGSDNEDRDDDHNNDNDDEDEVRQSRPGSKKPSRHQSPDDDEGGAADEDEDGGEDEEGGDDEDEDEEDDDDEDEEEVVGHQRKRRKRDARLQFIDVEAEVDEEDEEELDEDDELPEDTHPDDLLDMPAGAENDDRRHRELDRQRELEASMDAEKQAAALKERYGRNRASAVHSDVLPQRLLLPSVDDPTIWGVKCKPGKEKEVVYDIMKRFEDRLGTREPLEICSVFERGNVMSGYIYVEARKQAAALAACENISFCYPRGKMILVPLKEMPDLLRVKKSKELAEGMYVRIKGSGLYAGDLAQVTEVESNGNEVTVRLIPRLDYGLNEDPNALPDSKRKRPGTLTTRPPQRLFNDVEARKKHMKFLTQENSLAGHKIWNYKKDRYVDGFLEKTVKLPQLQTENVNPRLEEVTKFAAGGDDGTENLDLAALAATLKQASTGADYMPGDMVEIYQGEQQGVSGKAVAVHNDIVTLRVQEGDLKGQMVEAPVKSLRKLFKEGDHVKVVGGSKYHDEVGMVIKVRDDRVTLLTDSTNQEVTVFSRDLRVASDSGGMQGASKYDLFDLVQLDASTVACVIKVDRESLRVLDQNGAVRTLLPSNISNRVDRRKNAVATDRDGSEIRSEDTVKEYGGEQRQGRVLHIHRSFLFVQNKSRAENAGVFVVRSGNVTTVAAKSGKVSSAGPDLSKMNPLLQRQDLRQGPNGPGSMAPPKTMGRDRMMGKTVIVRKGAYKGLLGIVKDTTDLEARVELHTKNKTITVPKEILTIKDPVTGATIGPGTGRGRGMPGQGGFGGSTPGSRVPGGWGQAGGRTPMAAQSGGRTPAWGGASSRTPAWQQSGSSTSYGGAGGRTPAWNSSGSSRTPAWAGSNDGSRTAYGGGDGSRTAYGGGTSYGGSTAYGGSTSYGGDSPLFVPMYEQSRTSTWSASSRTPHGAGSSTWGSGNDGGRTPAWGASGGRTPAYQPNSLSSKDSASQPTPGSWAHPTPGAFDAPTPGFSAPTPAADQPTPRYGGYGGYGGYGATPAAAPTPGGYPETPAGYGPPETPAAGGGDDDGYA
ncbi:hypothetical protein GTA08_BOTSDO12934 [Botryosphaeria dothidea]|uniref:Transcription elongation factor SPT5 n=1 Tax=Botryosphaeria dothidea TaxID=55169 RepID=A0A8H4J436_9PEZI|nr:hypothetical protein GTA08_BOTSDO12934 [Botryosphaeria dothidea]